MRWTYHYNVEFSMILEIICNGLYFSRWQYRRTRAPHLGLAKFCIFGGGKFCSLPTYFPTPHDRMALQPPRTEQKWTKIWHWVFTEAHLIYYNKTNIFTFITSRLIQADLWYKNKSLFYGLFYISYNLYNYKLK